MERQPPGTPLKLMYLVNALVRVTEWFELGLQLGIEEHVLKRIDQDHRGQTVPCKSNMLSEWLSNDLDLSWERVHAAVEVVRSRSKENRRREEEKARQQVEERKTLEAISQVKKSIETINRTVDVCVKEKRKVAKKLEEKNKQWEKFKRGWRIEDEQWTKQEERMQRIKTAIAAGNLESEFVKRYLREKSVPTCVSKEAVESCLREDILQQEVVRVKQLLTRRQDTKNHQRALTHLQKDSEKWIEQLEDHKNRLERDILSNLEQMGLKPEKMRELQEHLKELGHTLRECKSALKDCDRALEKTEHHLMEFHQEMCVFFRSFNMSIQKLKRSSRGLKVRTTKLSESISDSKRLNASLVGGAVVAGAVAGGTVGAFLGPVGLLVGGLIGSFVGAVKGADLDDTQTLETHSQQLETLTTELTVSEEIARNCQRTEGNVKQLLQTFSKIM